ncbi:hypothetical protein N7513_002406 [Penicillium frequentans]|nr:hypothetical protein N7513_002406 [Penicillium glabrum]
MASTYPQPSDYEASCLLKFVISLLPVPASESYQLSASETSRLLSFLTSLASQPTPPQLSASEISCLQNFITRFPQPQVPVPQPLSAPTPAQVIPASKDPSFLNTAFSYHSEHSRALGGRTARDVRNSYSRYSGYLSPRRVNTGTPSPQPVQADMPSPQPIDTSQWGIIVTFTLYLWEHPKAPAVVRQGNSLASLNPSHMIHNFDEFAREKLMSRLPIFGNFRALPTDQIRLASGLRQEGKAKFSPEMIEGIDGDLNCSVKDFLDKIGTRKFCVIIERNEPQHVEIIDKHRACVAQIDPKIAAKADAQRNVERAIARTLREAAEGRFSRLPAVSSPTSTEATSSVTTDP